MTPLPTRLRRLRGPRAILVWTLLVLFALTAADWAFGFLGASSGRHGFALAMLALLLARLLFPITRLRNKGWRDVRSSRR